MSTEKQCSCSSDLKEAEPMKDCDCNQNKGKVDCGCGDTKNTNESQCGCAHGEEKRRRLNPVEAPRIYGDRRPVKGEVVTVIDATFSSSGIELSDAWSRAVRSGDVHEIMLWDPAGLENEDATAVAFVEVTQGGNIINGDEIKVDGEAVGILSGFDYNHMPNHMNLIVEVRSLNNLFKLGGVVEFVPNPTLDQHTDCC